MRAPVLDAEGFAQIMSNLYGGGPPVYGRLEDDVWALAHFIDKLRSMAQDEEDGHGYIYDTVRTLVK